MLIEEIKHINSSKSELRKFGLSVGIFLMLLGGVLWWFDKAVYIYLLGIGGGLALLGLVLPQILLPLQKVWMGIAVVLGFFMTRLILTILFYLVFTPISWIRKLGGNQFLVTGPDPSLDTYWNHRTEEVDASRYEKQF